MTLYVISHGETDWDREPARCKGWAEVALNEAGRARARQLGRALAARGLELVVSSHLRRAREASLIAREQLGDIPVVVDPRLAEIHRGDWEGRYLADLAAEEPAAWRACEEDALFRAPGGESAADQRRRVLAAVHDAALFGRPALLVTHDTAVRALLELTGPGGAPAMRELPAGGGIHALTTEGLLERIAVLLTL